MTALKTLANPQISDKAQTVFAKGATKIAPGSLNAAKGQVEEKPTHQPDTSTVAPAITGFSAEIAAFANFNAARAIANQTISPVAIPEMQLPSAARAVGQEASAVSGRLNPHQAYANFVRNNPGQSMVDQFLAGELGAELFEGAAGQLNMMILQEALQARSNFMNAMSNIMKKNDEAAATVVGNLR